MSGFKPIKWQFKKQNPPPTLPTTNTFWKDVDPEEDEQNTSESKESNNKEGSKPAKLNNRAKRLRMCYPCQSYDHLTKDCPKVLRLKKINKPSNKSASVESEKPGKKLLNLSITSQNKNASKNDTKEQVSGNTKCTFCGVDGHLIDVCPVKKWSVGPGGSESDVALKEDSTKVVDGDKPKTENPAIVPVPVPGQGSYESGPQIITLTGKQKKRQSKVPLELKREIKKMEKALLYNPAQMAEAQQMNLTRVPLKPQPPLPQVPVKQIPLPSPQLAIPNMPMYRQNFPAGIPKSFLNVEHQEQILQKTTKQPMGNTIPQPQSNQNLYTQDFWSPPQPVPPQLVPAEQQTFVPIQRDETVQNEPRQAYSPSDVYGDIKNDSGSTEPHEGSESPDLLGQKRLSAFQRLGPAQKKPKLTINLMCKEGEAVREVVDDTTEFIEEHTPVHLRSDVTTSTDETVMKYLYFWPWRKTVPIWRTAAYKNSKSAMLLEQEQMEESYDKDNTFIVITVTNYPRTWTKEDLFEVLLEQVNVIPCFIEFTSKECKFFVLRSKSALLSIHRMGFRIRKENLELVLKISVTTLTQNQIDFIPRLILRKRLVMGYDGEGRLNLKAFTLQSDISHFIYFPLSRTSNQTELVQLQSVVDWERLTELDISHNRLTSIDGFHLLNTCPNLKKLDVSHNNIDKIATLIHCRNLPLRSIYLEGNPLCHHYTNPADYVRIVRMLFPTIRTIDGVPIHFKGEMPSHRKNYCIHGSESLMEKYLDIYFPLLEAQPSDRQLIEDMYDENAVLTARYRYKFLHRLFRVTSSSTKFDDGIKDIVEGAPSITKYINKWPVMKHDPFSFTVDVLFHSEDSTIVKICGILKLTAESLAEDEHIVSFSRTVLLRSVDRVEYKIFNEILIWDEPSSECHATAFHITKIRSKNLYVDLEFDPNPDEETKEKLIIVFEHLTELDREASRKCLERRDWNLRSALDNFIQLLKLNDLSSISSTLIKPH